MTALREVAEALEATPPARQARTVLVVGPDQTSPVTPTTVVQLQCAQGGCTATPSWNPFGGHHGRYEPRRPSLLIIRQVAQTLITEIGHPISPTELKIALREAVSCSQPTATRAVRGAVRQGALHADRWNQLTVPPWPSPAESCPPGAVTR
jgi:hypothetical protein